MNSAKSCDDIISPGPSNGQMNVLSTQERRPWTPLSPPPQHQYPHPQPTHLKPSFLPRGFPKQKRELHQNQSPQHPLSLMNSPNLLHQLYLGVFKIASTS